MDFPSHGSSFISGTCGQIETPGQARESGVRIVFNKKNTNTGKVKEEVLNGREVYKGYC